MVSFGELVRGLYAAIAGPELFPFRPVLSSPPGNPPTTLGRGFGSSGVGFGVEYGTLRPGVRSVIDMAKVDCSGLFVSGETLAGGTGMYDVMRWNLDCFWMEYSGRGPEGVWMETARPRKQGMMTSCGAGRRGRMWV